MQFQPKEVGLKSIADLLPGTIVKWVSGYRIFDLAVVILDTEGNKKALALDGEHRFKFWLPSDPDFLILCHPEQLYVDLLECNNKASDHHVLGTLTLVPDRAFITARREENHIGHIFLGLSNWTLGAKGIGDGSYVVLSSWRLMRDDGRRLETIFNFESP